MTDREAFEEWFNAFNIKEMPEYQTIRDFGFAAWQAATAATQERCAQAVLNLDRQKWFPSQRDFAEACVNAIRKGEG